MWVQQREGGRPGAPGTGGGGGGVGGSVGRPRLEGALVGLAVHQGLTLVPISAQLERTSPISAQLKLTLSPI